VSDRAVDYVLLLLICMLVTSFRDVPFFFRD